jgi:hypothetical protein
VLALAAEMIVDWLVELPAAVRTGVVAVVLTGAVYAVLRHVLWPIVYGPDDETIALWVEHEEPDLRSRLISSVQLSRPGGVAAGASAGLVAALVRETEEMASPLDFGRVVKTDRLLRVSAITAVIVVLALSALSYAGPVGSDLLKRAMLVPGVDVPRKTRVEVLDGNRLIARGDAVRLAAVAKGIVPRGGTLRVQYDGADHAMTFAMGPDPKLAGGFAAGIENVQDSFTYAVQLNDGHSREYRVEAVPRPGVAALECQQVYPPYITRTDPRLATVRRAPGDLSLLAGSRLVLHVTPTKAVKLSPATRPGDGNHVHLVGSNVDFPLAADGDRLLAMEGDAKGLGVALPAGTSGFSVHLVDGHGIWSKDPVVYRIDLLPDKPPSVRVTFPERKEELVTQIATIIVGFDAADDFALGKATLKYKVDAQDNGAEKSVALAFEGNPRSLRGYHRWDISKLNIPEKSTIEWWVEVEDTNDQTGPGRADSEHYQARVVSEAEKRADLFQRLGASWEEMNEVSNSEQELNRKLGTMILEKR